MLLRKGPSEKANSHSKGDKSYSNKVDCIEDFTSTSRDKPITKSITKYKHKDNVKANFSQSMERRINVTNTQRKKRANHNFNVSKQTNSISQSKFTDDSIGIVNHKFPRVSNNISKQATRETLDMRNSELSNINNLANTNNVFERHQLQSALDCDNLPSDPRISKFVDEKDNNIKYLTMRNTAKDNFVVSQSLDMTGLDVHQNELSDNSSPKPHKISLKNKISQEKRLQSNITSRDTLRDLIKLKNKNNSLINDEKIQIIHSKSERQNEISYINTSRKDFSPKEKSKGRSKSRKRCCGHKKSVVKKEKDQKSPPKKHSAYLSTSLYQETDMLNTFDNEFLDDLEQSGDNKHYIDRYMDYVNTSRGKKFVQLKESKVPRLRKYVKRENKKYINAVKLIKANDMRELNQVSINFNSFIYGNPISFDVTSDFIAKEKMQLLDKTYNIVSLNVLTYRGPIKIMISEPVDQVFWVSTKTPNPTKENHDQFFDNVDCFTLFFDEFENFSTIFIKVLALQNCEFVITIKSQQKRDKFRKTNNKGNNSFSEGTKIPKTDRLFKIRDMKAKNQNFVDQKQREKAYIPHKQFIDELNKMDIFLTKKHGRQYTPKEELEKPDFVESNMSTAKNHTRLNKTIQIRQRSLDMKEYSQQSKKKRDLMYAQILESKISFQSRHKEIMSERINDEMEEAVRQEKLYKCASWIYFIKAIHFFHHIFWRFKHWKLRAFIAKVQMRKLVNLQRWLKSTVLQREPPANRIILYSRMIFRMKVLYTRKKVQKQCVKMLGTLLRGYAKSSFLLQTIQTYKMNIKNIQKRWRYTMSWKKNQVEKLTSAWEKEIANVDYWETGRNLKLLSRKLPKDKFCIKTHLRFLSKRTQNNVASYLIDLQLLDYIDMKFEMSYVRLRDLEKTRQTDSDTKNQKHDYSSSLFDVITMEKTPKGTTLTTKNNFQNLALLGNTASNFEASYMQKFNREKLEGVYNSKKWDKFLLLVKKAKTVAGDFVDYNEEAEDLEQQIESPTRSTKYRRSLRSQISRKSSKSPKKIEKPQASIIKSSEDILIEQISKMAWNVNLRNSMPKQTSFTFKYDSPFMRALIYYIIQNTSKKTANYDYIDANIDETINEDNNEKVANLLGDYLTKKGNAKHREDKKIAGANINKVAALLGNTKKIDTLIVEQARLNSPKRRKKSSSKSPSQNKTLQKTPINTKSPTKPKRASSNYSKPKNKR